MLIYSFRASGIFFKQIMRIIQVPGWAKLCRPSGTFGTWTRRMLALLRILVLSIEIGDL
jgi:hypothetical protein